VCCLFCLTFSDAGASVETEKSSTKEKDAPAQRRSKKKHDGASSSEHPEESVADTNFDVQPLQSMKFTDLTWILDMQGIIQHSVYHTAEEGEITHSLSKEQIAELFDLNPDEVDDKEEDVPASADPVQDEFVDVDRVEIEDITAEEYPEYISKDQEDLPHIHEFFKQANEQIIKEQLIQKGNVANQTEEERIELIKLKKMWIEHMKEEKKKVPEPPTSYTKAYKIKVHKTNGQILSWAYFKDLQCYGVKREKGIDYFEFPHDIKTLPGFDVNRLAQLPMLYSDTSGMSKWFAQQIQVEYRRKWVNF